MENNLINNRSRKIADKDMPYLAENLKRLNGLQEVNINLDG